LASRCAERLEKRTAKLSYGTYDSKQGGGCPPLLRFNPGC
jgi:hypothetical protein